MAKKKVGDIAIDVKRELIDREVEELTISRQCELLNLSRSTFYYDYCRGDEFNLQVMRKMDELYTENPFYGTRRMSVELKKMGFLVGRGLARTLMRRMGIEAIYPKPNLSKAHPGNKIYPYLLRGVDVNRKNQVWSTDITYIRMSAGYLYLTAIIDWHCRYVLSWKLSNSLDSAFCREALEEALNLGRPEIFNTDQGSQFTSTRFTEILVNNGIRISMDGRGRALDNVFIERFWRTLKQEEVYIKDYRDGLEAYQSLSKYICFYNKKRPHSSLGYLAPENVYRGEK